MKRLLKLIKIISLGFLGIIVIGVILGLMDSDESYENYQSVGAYELSEHELAEKFIADVFEHEFSGLVELDRVAIRSHHEWDLDEEGEIIGGETDKYMINIRFNWVSNSDRNARELIEVYMNDIAVMLASEGFEDIVLIHVSVRAPYLSDTYVARSTWNRGSEENILRVANNTMEFHSPL